MEIRLDRHIQFDDIGHRVDLQKAGGGVLRWLPSRQWSVKYGSRRPDNTDMWHLNVTAKEKRPRSRTFQLALMLAIGGVLLAVGIADLRETQRLRADGEFARAKVTGRHKSGGKSRSYYLDVEFQSRGGQLVALTESVSRGRYERTKPGDTVPLHYLLSDPSVMKIGAKPQPDTSWFIMSLGAFIVTGTYYLVGKWRQARRNTCDRAYC